MTPEIFLTIAGVQVPIDDLHMYALRFNSTDDGDIETSLYVNGRRTTMPWTLTMNIGGLGGGDSSG